MKVITRSFALCGVALTALPLSALAVSRVWPEGERPSAITRWWVNSKLQWGDNFPVLVCVVAIVSISAIWLAVAIYRNRKGLMLFRKG